MADDLDAVVKALHDTIARLRQERDEAREDWDTSQDALTTAIFLVLGGRAVVLGTLTAGGFTAFVAYLQMLRWPMLGAGFTINLLQRAAASMSRINAVLEEEPDRGYAGLPDRALKQILRAPSWLREKLADRLVDLYYDVIDVGEGAAPAFGDANGDGLSDLAEHTLKTHQGVHHQCTGHLL